MTHRQGLSLPDRFKESVLDAVERKGEDIEAVKNERRKEVKEASKDVLKSGKGKFSNRPLPGSQSIEEHKRRSFTPIPTNWTTAGPSKPTPLPTPPGSPISSAHTKAFDGATEEAETSGSQELKGIRTCLRNHEAEIASLRLQLADVKAEVRDLDQSYRNASREVAKAVCNGKEAAIQEGKEREQELLGLLEQKEQMIDKLREEIVQKKEREGELRERLAEMEGRQKVRESKSKGQEEVVHRGPSLGERKLLKGGGKDWEFRRKKGEKMTPLRAGSRILRGI